MKTSRILGFSIVEALITLLVLSIGLIALAKFSGSLTSEGAHAKSRTEASNIGERKLEEFRNYKDVASYDAYVSGVDTVGPTGSGAMIEMSNLNQSYQRQWTVTDNGSYKSINIQVSWPDKNGVYFMPDNVATLQTIIARVNPVTPALTPMATSATTTTTAATTTTTIGAVTTTAATTTTTAATTTTTAATTTTTAATTTTTAATTTTTAATTTTTAVPVTTTTTTYPPTPVTCNCKKGVPTGSSVGQFGCTSCCSVSPYSNGNSTHNCTIINGSGTCTNP